QNEAQAAAHLHHQNIVPVHAVGCERGVHYYAMQLIDGQTLAAVIRELRRRTGATPASGPRAAGAPASALALGGWPPARRAQAGAQPTPEDALAAPPPPPPRAPGENGQAEEAPAEPAAAATPGLSSERSHKTAAFFRTVASLGIQAAEALEHAHQLGVIHRDV